MSHIKFLDIYNQDKKIFKKILANISRAIKNNKFILTKEVSEFEKKFAKYCNTKYAIGSAAIASKKIERSSGSDIIVMLAVAHHNADHYNSDTGTLFLDYLCDILTALVQRQLS